METPNTEPEKLMKLRRDAEGRIKEGAAPTTLGWWLDANALGSIHKLASSPESAPDALKLLHEVQVHQVELDLQHEEMESTQRELAEQLARFEELYESAPVGYVTLSPRREILECNKAAASLLGMKADEVRGRKLSSFLAPASRPAVQQLLDGLRPDGASERCEVRLLAAGAQPKPQIVVASLPPGGRAFLVVIVDLANGE